MKERARKANRITWIGFVVNLVLTIAKFLAGFFGNSAAMIADAVHSLSDFATDIVVLLSFRIIGKPADEDHDYGHGKYETLATAFIGVALIIVGIGIFWSGLSNIIAHFHGEHGEGPNILAFLAAIVSIIVKELLYRYTKKVGQEIESDAVIANAWHHRSDAFSSIGTMLGIGGALLLGEKFNVLDHIAALVVSFFIVKVACEISLGSVKELSEASLPEETETEIMNLVSTVQGAHNPHDLRTRKIGASVAVELHIDVLHTLSICEAHAIATGVEHVICERFGKNTFVSVHMEPAED